MSDDLYTSAFETITISKEKTPMKASTVLSWGALGLACFLVVAGYLGRYTAVQSNNGVTTVVDRYTGDARYCYPGRGCMPMNELPGR